MSYTTLLPGNHSLPVANPPPLNTSSHLSPNGPLCIQLRPTFAICRHDSSFRGLTTAGEGKVKEGKVKNKRISTVKHLANISGGGTKYHIKATLSMGCRPASATDACQEPPWRCQLPQRGKNEKARHSPRNSYGHSDAVSQEMCARLLFCATLIPGQHHQRDPKKRAHPIWGSAQ